MTEYSQVSQKNWMLTGDGRMKFLKFKNYTIRAESNKEYIYLDCHQCSPGVSRLECIYSKPRILGPNCEHVNLKEINKLVFLIKLNND